MLALSAVVPATLALRLVGISLGLSLGAQVSQAQMLGKLGLGAKALRQANLRRSGKLSSGSRALYKLSTCAYGLGQAKLRSSGA